MYREREPDGSGTIKALLIYCIIMCSVIHPLNSRNWETMGVRSGGQDQNCTAKDCTISNNQYTVATVTTLNAVQIYLSGNCLLANMQDFLQEFQVNLPGTVSTEKIPLRC